MKKKWYWVVALIFTVFISCCTGMTPEVTFKAKIWPPTSLEQCENFDNFPTKIGEHSKTDCYMALATKNKDESICDFIEVSGQEQLCIYSVAIEKKDLSSCKQLLNDSDKKLCEDEINCKLKPTECVRCNSMETDIERSNCIVNLAIGEKNITFCNYVEVSAYQTNCVSSILDTISAKIGWDNIPLSLCDSLNNSKSKDACLSRIARNTKNTTICSQIKDDYYRNWCLGK